MSEQKEGVALRFLSLFVPDLVEAQRRYEAILGVSAQEDDRSAPSPHPFAAKGPVIFDLAGVCLALYQCNNQQTHPGDVGIGLEASAAEIASRASQNQGQVFFGPQTAPGDGRQMAVFVLPDRHFFEVLDSEHLLKK
jgi:hypothetical protein